MNALDLIIIATLLAAIARGVFQGAVMQILPFGGFWLGLLVGSAVAPFAARLAGSQGGKAIVSLVALFGIAFMFSGIGRQIGMRIWRVIRRARLGVADALGGALVSGAATLFGVWLLATILAGLPFPGVAQQIHRSQIVRALDDALPPAPQIFSRVRQLVGGNLFPDVFAGLEPGVAQPVAPPGDPAVRAAQDAAGPATLKVVGNGCGGIKTGSGFIGDERLVVTNAHVIAGIDRPTVESRGGRRRATTPVLFDKNLDIAILRTSGLGTPPLPIEDEQVGRGTGGAVIGYPGGGPQTAGAGAVLARFRAQGRDIYGRDLTSREVYQLQAVVRPGNSGGPFVRQDGEVIGVIFSASATEPDVGYAITSGEVNPLIAQARGRTSATDTGPCD